MRAYKTVILHGNGIQTYSLYTLNENKVIHGQIIFVRQ